MAAGVGTVKIFFAPDLSVTSKTVAIRWGGARLIFVAEEAAAEAAARRAFDAPSMVATALAEAALVA